MFRNYRRRTWLVVTCVALLAAAVTLDSRLVKGEDAYAAVEDNMEEFSEALKLLSNSYHRVLDTDSLTASAIEGMVDDLDPYTQFLKPRDYEELMIDTSGKFGGLGITISLRGGKVPVVLSVIEGTPADTSGLLMGDRIAKIEGDSTSGQSLQEVVDKLRGTPGDAVVVTVDRPGKAKPFEQHIVRDRIRIKSVLAAPDLDPEVGYISMSSLLVHGSRFMESSPQELEQAIKRLKAAGAKAVILDLRGNPGGLLSQAVDVADKFLDPGLPVVTTRGRIASQNQEYKTRSASVLNGMPLVVLVDGHSASASEIVAGAIQDSDRGLIVGTPTFGKGSVQSFREIGDRKALKWTTALYYTPSGRSIHRAARRRSRSGGPMVSVGDKELPAWQVLAVIADSEDRAAAVFELTERFDLDAIEADQLIDMQLSQLTGQGQPKVASDGEKTGEKYLTRGGRTVYGGGGITPDVEVQPERLPQVALALGRQGLFFDFAVDYAARSRLPDSPTGYMLPDEVVDDFYAFIDDTTRTGSRFSYHTPSQARLRDLEQAMADAEMQTEEGTRAIEALRKMALMERKGELAEARPFILAEIERRLAQRVWGTEGFVLASLKSDKQYLEAVAILKDPARYQKSLNLAMAAEK
jgi:carboxyl-terminal processing protease